MVHALKEAWRVLRQAGLLIDLRPISVDVLVLILTWEGWKPAGVPDQSPDRMDDLAADQAVREVIREGMFTRVKREYFQVNNYWDSLKDLREDVEECWKGDVLVSAETWRTARVLYKNGSGKRRILIPFRKKVSIYQKNQLTKG